MLLHIQFEKTSDDEEVSDLNGIMRLEIVRTLLNFGRLEVNKVGCVLGLPGGQVTNRGAEDCKTGIACCVHRSAHGECCH